MLLHLFLSQKVNVNRAYYNGIISDSAKQKLLNEIDKQLLDLESDEDEGNI